MTGSCHLITTEKHKILLDCGQFQGGAEVEAMNREDFPFNPAEIECVVVSHAHIDHCGRLPLLVKRGFKGRIYATDATADLLDIMLKDSAHIHEQEAEWRERKSRRAGRESLGPLFTMQDAEDTLPLITPVLYDTLVEINDEMKICYNDAGHILGSGIVELWVTEGETSTKLVFTGDLGMSDRPILRDPTVIKKADCLIMETTYGGRLHESNQQSIDKLAQICVETVKRGGNVVIPSFAVGRTQELLFEFNKIYDGDTPYTKDLKGIPVYVDSPMAKAATEVFRKNAQVYDNEMREYILKGDHPLDFEGLHFVVSSQESQALNVDLSPKIILSASGMCDAGRIRHHLKHNLWNPKSSVVFVGYQAEGTLGRRLIDGEKTVTIFGEEIAVNAQIHNLEGFSGHADRDGLFAWLSSFEAKPKNVFLVHGELEAKEAFAEFVKERLGWKLTVVRGYNEYDLGSGTVAETTAEHEFAGEEQLEDVRKRLADIHEALERVMYNTQSAIESGLTPEHLTEIKNVVASLEKDSLALGAAVADK